MYSDKSVIDETCIDNVTWAS